MRRMVSRSCSGIRDNEAKRNSIYGNQSRITRVSQQSHVDRFAGWWTIGSRIVKDFYSGPTMEKLKPYLPVACAALFACTLFAVDSTAYHNAANEVDYGKAFAAFVTLWGMFTAFFKANPQ